jgi:hypothetical protein
MTTEREHEQLQPDASDVLVRAHERLVASGVRGAALSGMMAIGNLAPSSDRKAN